MLEGVTGPALDALAVGRRVARAAEVPAGAWAGVRALVVRNATRVDTALLDRLPALEIVARAGAGLDTIDVDAADRAGVVVSYAPTENTDATAEHTLALALAVAHRIVELDASTRAGGWERLQTRELRGAVWGVVGLGRIGRAVADLARGIGMTAVAADPAVSSADARAIGVELLPPAEVLARSLVVSLHVPLTAATRGLIGAEELALLRPEAILVSTARGELVDEDALADALCAGRLAGAGLDVRAAEPPARPDRLAALPQVVLTPHVAGLSGEAQRRVLDTVIGDVRAVLDGGRATSAAGRAEPARPR